MSAKHLIAFTLLFLIFSSTAHAQGEFLRHSEFGVAVFPQMMISGDGLSYGGTASFCIRGIIDLGCGYSYSDDAELGMVSPMVTLHITGKGKKYAPGAAVSVAFVSVKGDLPQYSLLKHDFTTIGFAGFVNCRVGKDVLVQPALAATISYNRDYDSWASDTTLSYSMLQSVSKQRHTATWGGGITFCWGQRQSLRPFLGVGLTMSTDENVDPAASIGFGLLTAW